MPISHAQHSAVIHELAEAIGLNHFSKGENENRFIVVAKKGVKQKAKRENAGEAVVEPVQSNTAVPQPSPSPAASPAPPLSSPPSAASPIKQPPAPKQPTQQQKAKPKNKPKEKKPKQEEPEDIDSLLQQFNTYVGSILRCVSLLR
jgi:outer membrane biosynthesis protein TonB